MAKVLNLIKPFKFKFSNIAENSERGQTQPQFLQLKSIGVVMRKFTLLSALGALLSLSALNVHADVVSCTWVDVAGYSSPSGGGKAQVCFQNPSARTGAVASRQLDVAQGCINLSAYSGYTASGSCSSPTFYTTPVSSAPSTSSSVSSSSAPATKVVNGVTIPYSATVYDQGQCYSYGCQTPAQKCWSYYSGATFAQAPYPSQNYVCYK